MSSLLHQRTSIQNPFTNRFPFSPPSSTNSQKRISIFSPIALLVLLSLVVVFGVFSPWVDIPQGIFSPSEPAISKWRHYTLAQALPFVAKNGTVVVCIVSQPYLAFLNNWLISITRQKRQNMVLVIAEDYATLYKVNERWPGHAVLIPPVLDGEAAHKFGSQGFFNFTARRPRHLLQILELGYNVMYNDVDMVWLADPFPYLEGNHDVYFTDDMTTIKPLNHSHDLPPPGKKGRPYICSCMIFLRTTDGAKLIMKKWIEELQLQPWSKTKKSNDQPAFNWALMKAAKEVDMYLLPQSAFPTGGLYFKNKTWVKETKGMHVIIHNNYIVGFEKKTKRFRDYGLWLVDDHALESPLDLERRYSYSPLASWRTDECHSIIGWRVNSVMKILSQQVLQKSSVMKWIKNRYMTEVCLMEKCACLLNVLGLQHFCELDLPQRELNWTWAKIIIVASIVSAGTGVIFYCPSF